MPTAELLRLAEILDGRVRVPRGLGRRRLRRAVRRGVESPWERIRALKARTKTPLALALRGRFLVGSRPVGGDFARRFVACAAESGIDVFRLHDPLNDVENLREAAEAIVGAGREFDAGLLYGSGRHEALVEAAKRLPELGATRILLHDPAALLQPHRAGELVAELREVSGLPVGIYCQGAGGNALAAALEAARAGADLIATAVYPVALPCTASRPSRSRRRWPASGWTPASTCERSGGRAELVDEHIGDEPVSPVAPRIAVRAAQHKLPVGLVAALDVQLRAQAAGDRLDEVLDELDQVRDEVGSPPLAAPIGQIVASQALLNVLSANRYGTMVDELRDLVAGASAARPARSTLRSRAPSSCRRRAPSEPRRSRHAARRGRGARRERGGAAAARALRRGGRAAAARDPRALQRRGVAGRAAASTRSAPRGSARSCGSCRRRASARSRSRRTACASACAAPPSRRCAPAAAPLAAAGEPEPPPARRATTRCSASRARWSARSTARPRPGSPPFVEEGDAVAPGQTLCILEAMKLMNEVKAEAEASCARCTSRAASRSSTDSSSSSSSRSTAARSTRSSARCSREFS